MDALKDKVKEVEEMLARKDKESIEMKVCKVLIIDIRKGLAYQIERVRTFLSNSNCK